MGDTQDVEAEDLQLAIAFSVGLERRRGAVELPAVRLDNQPSITPEEVDLVGADRDVLLGGRHTMPAAEAMNQALEVALRAVGREALLRADVEPEDLGAANRRG